MIIYRPQRGSLSDTLKDASEFQTEEEMKQSIYEEWSNYYLEIGYKNSPFEIDDIVIGSETFDDERCGWHDARYVCVKRMGEEVYETPQCIGMCATDYGR